MLTSAERDDICRSYREAKNKELQIDILRDLYLTSKEEIIEVLTESGDYIPKRQGRPVKSQVVVKKAEVVREPVDKKEPLTQIAKKSYPLNRPGDAVVAAIKKELDRVSLDVAAKRQQLSLEEQQMGELADFLKSIGEEV